MSGLRFTYGNLLLDFSSEKVLGDNCDYRHSVFYQKDEQSDLSVLCDKYGSDKGEAKPFGHPYSWPSHTYADFYEGRFAHCRDHIKTVFECGLGTNNPDLPSSMGVSGKPGAPLRVWRDYFPNAHIYGADIDEQILFDEERISTFFVDQTSKESIAALWERVEIPEIDIMIDDGLHTFEAGVCLFEHSFQKLRKHGLYVIEDVSGIPMINFRSYFSGKKHRVEFIDMFRPNHPLGDNPLIVVRK